MAPASRDNVFITYNDPTELRSKQNRRAVSSFASKSYRPTSRRIVLDRTHYHPFVRRPDGATPTPSTAKAKKKGIASDKKDSASSHPDETLFPRPQLRNDCALGSPMSDPFTTYPIPNKAYVPFLVDYCEYIRHDSLPILLPFMSAPTRLCVPDLLGRC